MSKKVKRFLLVESTWSDSASISHIYDYTRAKDIDEAIEFFNENYTLEFIYQNDILELK